MCCAEGERLFRDDREAVKELLGGSMNFRMVTAISDSSGSRKCGLALYSEGSVSKSRRGRSFPECVTQREPVEPPALRSSAIIVGGG
jgi:hypothetical protein